MVLLFYSAVVVLVVGASRPTSQKSCVGWVWVCAVSVCVCGGRVPGSDCGENELRAESSQRYYHQQQLGHALDTRNTFYSGYISVRDIYDGLPSHRLIVPPVYLLVQHEKTRAPGRDLYTVSAKIITNGVQDIK